MSAAGPWAGRIVEVLDEREPVTRAALAIIRDTFPPAERQPLDNLAMEVRERRLGLTEDDPYHLLAAISEEGRAMAVAAGVYLGPCNAGLVTYLGVSPEFRTRRLGLGIRTALVEAFRADARGLGRGELRWVVGEVRLENPWLRRLVRDRAAVPFDLTYYHPGVGPGWSPEEWILYRQPVADDRRALPAREVARLIYRIWRRAYRVRWPLEHEGFAAMMEELDAREEVGAHPAFEA
jgi:hypothetical protein